MALEKTITTQHGIVVNNAYHKVDNVVIRNKNQMEFNVKIFVSKEQNVPFELLAFVCAYDIQGDNPIRQAYKHLKTLQEFSDAIDC